MKVCYLILLHHKFDQALRLIRRLAAPGSSFVFHIDSAAAKPAAGFRVGVQSLTSEPVYYAPAVNSPWGAYRQALAILHCVQTAVREAPPSDRYILLSGQDYPIKARSTMEAFFAAHSDKEFIEAVPRHVTDPEATGWSPYYRFRRYHFWLGNRHLTVPLVRKGLPPLPIYHGSTWWALTRAAVEYIARQFDSNRSLRRYLRTGFLVDEVYIPTLMMASPLAKNMVYENVTYAQWTATSGPHPKMLRIEDLDALLESPKLFARKFDAEFDKALMDNLDALHDSIAPS